MKSMYGCAALGACALLAWAGGTKSWEHGSQADFQKGKLTKLALRSDGRLSLAPVWQELDDPSTSYLWAVAEDNGGNVYYGGSGQDNKARLFVKAAGGASKTLAELNGLEIHAITLDGRGNVFAATSPDGKVYRVTAAGAVEEYYDPKAKYIWALAFNTKGELFVATGDQGEIHRVTAARTGSVFYKTEESHARSLLVDAQGNVIVGTEPSGLVMRITPAGQGYVLYQTSKREVTALAADAKGSIYAAGVGTRSASSPAPGAPAPPPPPPAAAPGAAPGTAGRPPMAPPLSAGASVSGGSEVVRIEADGYPRKLWSDDKDIVYALAFDKEGRLVVATGNRGNLYRLDSDLFWSQIVSAAPTQITGLATGRNGRILAVTGNIGKLFRLGPEIEREGTYEGDAMDAGFFTYWGRMNYTGELNGGAVKLETRSGNLDSPQRAWSPWAAVPLAGTHGRIASPAARFLQYKLTLTSASGTKTPELGGVDIAYLQKNVAPDIEIIELTPPNYRFPAATISLATNNQNISLPALGRQTRSVATVLSSSDTPASSMNYAKGFLGARWLIRDENGDLLVAKVDIRGEKETTWKPLRDESRERNFAFDSTAFPDGDYRLRLTVSDSLSNSPAEALTATMESDVFTVDNTPPRVTGLAGSRNGNKLEVKWKAADALSVISKAEYSVNGGEWKTAEPTTRLTDSAEHEYVITVEGAAAGENTVAVRVVDYYDNQGVDKVIVK